MFIVKTIKTPERIKGALKGLRQFLITESPLKMMKNAEKTARLER